MKPLAKVGLVAGGYVAAFLIALAIAALYIAVANRTGRQASGGMSAFGDSILFLGVFALASVPATAVGLFFLRPYPLFWRAWSIAAGLIAATAVAAAVAYAIERAAGPAVAARGWASYATFRILAAPMFGLLFLVSGLFAPRRSARFVLLSAFVAEAAAFGVFAVSLIRWPKI